MANKLISALTAGSNTGVFGLPYATTTYDAETNTFTATVQNNAPFSLEPGAQVVVKFSNAIGGYCYLDVNGTGAAQFSGGYWPSKYGGTYLCIYDGSFWGLQYTMSYDWAITNGSLKYDSDGFGEFTVSKSGVSSSPQAMPDSGWPEYNLTFPQTTGTLIADTTLANGSTAGVIKTTSTVTSSSGYTACPVINGVPYYKATGTSTGTDTGTDTKVKVTTETKTKATLLGVNATGYTSGATTDKVLTDTDVYLGTEPGTICAGTSITVGDPETLLYSVLSVNSLEHTDPDGTMTYGHNGISGTGYSDEGYYSGSVTFDKLFAFDGRITSLESQLNGLATALEELHSGS